MAAFTVVAGKHKGKTVYANVKDNPLDKTQVMRCDNEGLPVYGGLAGLRTLTVSSSVTNEPPYFKIAQSFLKAV